MDTNLLKFLPFKDFNLRWDAKYHIQKYIKSNYPLISLGELILEKSDKIKPNEKPLEDFYILGVSNKHGIFDAYVEKGEKINQPYKKVREGYLAFNPYRINVGSIGLKSSKQKHNLISNAYVVFSCKESLIPDFLYKVFKTKRYNQFIRANTTGSVRQNLGFDVLQEMSIPLPKIEEQRQLLNKYKSKIDDSLKQELEANNHEQEIEKYLLKFLNINPIKLRCVNKSGHETILTLCPYERKKNNSETS